MKELEPLIGPFLAQLLSTPEGRKQFNDSVMEWYTRPLRKLKLDDK